MLADLNLFIRARSIFVFPLQELRGKIHIGDLYYHETARHVFATFQYLAKEMRDQFQNGWTRIHIRFSFTSVKGA
jgi:hypothetical protein